MKNDHCFIPATIDDCQWVLAEYPDLTASGFTAGPKPFVPLTDLDVRLQISKGRRFLKDVCDPAARPPALGQGHGSYGLKHMAERWVPHYICNGALIAAAVLEEYPMRRQRINAILGLRFVPWYQRLKRRGMWPTCPEFDELFQ